MSDEKNFNLNQELDAKSSELEVQRKEMLKKGVKLTLQDIVNKIEPHTEEITALMIGKIQKAQLQNLAASVIVDGADGRVRVPAFTEQNDKTSPVWVFVGTHWEVIDNVQLFFDFIRDACTKMGLGMEFVDDVPFFRKLKKQVEWKLSRHTETEEDENVVLVNFINVTLVIHRDGTSPRGFLPICASILLRPAGRVSSFPKVHG